MTFSTARVVNGRIELSRDDFPDGTEVTVLTSEPIHELSADDEAELERRLADVQAGDFVRWAELQARLSVK